ncbi:(2Fe-2S)-binding protein [Actinomycetospora sp. C-140]
MSSGTTGRRRNIPGAGAAPNAGPDRVRTVLAACDAVDGFFAISTRDVEAADPSWRPLARFLAVPEQGADPLAQRLEQVAAGLGAPRRVAASLLGQSLASRSVSVLLAAAAQGVLPDLSPVSVLHARAWPGGPMPLWADPERLDGVLLGAPDDPGTAAAVARALAEDHVAPVVAAMRARASVSERVLWGNAAGALGGAVRVLGSARPDLHDAALALARGVLGQEPFAGLGGFVADPDHPSGLGFARTTCCLYYQVPGGGKCGDCVLNRR